MNRPIVTLTLPWPPSVNGYWRSIVRGKRVAQILSEKGREYKVTAAASITEQNAGSIMGDIRITERFYPPCRRRRDMDNHRKAIRDALTECGVIEDDSKIKRDIGEWCQVDTKNPRVEITIEPLETA